MSSRARSYSVTEMNSSPGAALRAVRSGQVVEITVHGRPVAQIVPSVSRRNTEEEERALLERFADRLNFEAAGCIENQAKL